VWTPNWKSHQLMTSLVPKTESCHNGEKFLPMSSQLREQIDELVRPLGLQTRLVVLEPQKSIAVIFICMTLSALKSLRHQWSSGQLKDIVQSLFTFLSSATDTVRVKRLTWPHTDYKRSLKFYSSVQGEHAVCFCHKKLMTN